MTMKKIFLFLISLALFTSCERKIDEFSVSKGSADFTKFVSVGNSLIAGYADAALYHNGQVYSIPNLLAGQLQLAGSGSFVQPMVTSEFGVSFPGSLPKLKLGYGQDCLSQPYFGPVPDIGVKDPVASVGYAVNNFGIPGAKANHLLFPGYALANPYYARFASSPTATVLGDIVAANASFFAMWLGDNDVLSYALSGGVGDTITQPQYFQGYMGYILQTMTANGAKGVISNIPDVTAIPFFTTVPYNGLVLTRQSLVDSVNYAMATVYGHPELVYHVGQNPFLVSDPGSANPYFKVRFMAPGELVLLSVPQDSLKCRGMGIINVETHVPYPIPTQYVLTAEEVTALQTNTSAYNQIIAGLAQTFDLALVDMNSNFKLMEKGIVWDGINLNAVFVKGGLFSLDGIHPTPRGAAVAANYFINSINAKYGSTIPQVNITKYNGVLFP
jgi:hypothetical protein